MTYQKMDDQFIPVRDALREALYDFLSTYYGPPCPDRKHTMPGEDSCPHCKRWNAYFTFFDGDPNA